MDSTPYMLMLDGNRPIEWGSPDDRNFATLSQTMANVRMPSFTVPNKAAKINPMSNDNADLQPPGVRDLIANPGFFAVDRHRTNLYDNNSASNRPQLPNWDVVYKDHTSPWNRRIGTFWWNKLQEKVYIPGFVDQGQYVTPCTGFTSFRFLRPHSSLRDSTL